MDTMTVPYVSCIKLRGCPILPPVMDVHRRKDMQRYKDQAICVEKRLLYLKRVSMDSGLSTATNGECTTDRDIPTSPQNNQDTINAALAQTDCSSADESNCNEVVVKEMQSNGILVPSTCEFPSRSCTPISDQLAVGPCADSCGTKTDSEMNQSFKVTPTPQEQCLDKKNDNGCQLDETFSSVAMSASTDLNHYVDSSLASSATSLPDVEQPEIVFPVSELLPLCMSDLKLQHKSLIRGGDCAFGIEGPNPLKSDTNQHGQASVPEPNSEIPCPRLVRSNSYTLEAPSPVLLAHVEQVKRNCSSRDSLLPGRRCWTIPPEGKVLRKLEYPEPQPAKNSSKCKTVARRLSTSLPSSTASSPVKMRPACASIDSISHKLLVSGLRKPLKATTIATAPNCKSANSSQSLLGSSNHVFHSIETFNTGGGMDIRALFAELQSKYEREKAELLARQKKEQEEMEVMFRNQCEQLVATLRQLPQLPVTTQVSSSLSLFRATSPSSPQFEMVKAGNLPQPSSSNNQMLTYSDAEKKAASVIGAAVRGYMVRRLMRTERVQSLKATILDTVQCALRLEQECQVEVTPADVELHRGLITQLNAAILEFHHLFFSTSVRERMEVVAADRLRLNRQQSRASSQCALSAATKKYLQRKSLGGSLVDSSRPNSSRSNGRECRCSSGGSSRGNSVASAPVTRRELVRENGSWRRCKRSNSSSQVRKPWR